MDYLVDRAELVRLWGRYPCVGAAADHFVVPEASILKKLAWMRGYGSYAA